MAFGNSIIARLGLDSRDFREGIATARAALGGFTTGAVGTLISGAAIKGLIEYGDKIQDLSERYDVNAESLQRLGNVAEKEGSSLDGVARAYDKLIKNSDAALQGNKEMIQSFADLGITVEDLRTLSPEEIMLKIGHGSMRASDLVKVLGKSAQELGPTLKKLAEGTVEIGGAISAEDIERLGELSDKWKELVETVRTLGAGVLVQIADEIRYIADGLKNVAKGIGAQFNAIAALTKGDIAAFKREVAVLKESVEYALVDAVSGGSEYKERKAFEAAEKAAAKAAKEVVAKDGPAKSKSKAEITAEQKERERNQLSLADLQEGPTYADANKASLQAIHAAQTAREVKRLEEEAFRQRHQQADFEGSRRTLDRADALRQTIPGLTESDKMVGAFRSILEASGMPRNIAVIAGEMVKEE